MESPLILVLVKFFLKFFAYCCSILSIPVTIYSIILNKILKYDTKDNAGGHFLIFIPRIILTIPFPFSFPLLAYLYGWLVDLAINGKTFMPFVIAIGFFVAIGIGFWFTRSMSFLKDSISQFKIKGSDSYLNGLKESFLDIGATFSFFISICTVIRIPSMILSLAYRSDLKPSHQKIRTNLYRHLLLIPFDFIAFFSYLFILITILRIKPLHDRIINKYNTINHKLFNVGLRISIFRNFIIVLLEFFIMFLCFIFLLAPWRIKVAIEKVRNATKQAHAFGEIFKQQMNGLVDLGVIILALPLLISFYRLPYAIRRTFERTTANSRRSFILWQSLFVFVDIFIILFFIIILATIYRFPRTIRKIIAQRNRYYEHIFLQFIKIFRDIPFVLMGLFTCIAVWRAPFMLAQVFKEPHWHVRRRIVTKHFSYIFIDILDIPFIISSLIILVTLWRSYAFVCGFITLDTRKKQRIFVIKQMFYWLMDIPTFFALLFITLTVYRLPKTAKLLNIYFKNVDFSKYTSSMNKRDKVVNINTSYPIISSPIYDQDNPPPPANMEEDNPTPVVSSVKNESNSSNPELEEIKDYSSWRSIVAKQFLLCIIDIPFPILTLLTLWRLPIMIKRYREIDDPLRKYTLRRLLILRYVWLTFLDIICIPAALFIIITLWRIPSFIKLFKVYQRGDNEHKMFGLLFWNTLVDIPFVFMGILTLPIPWRGVFLIRTLIYDKENVKNDKDARWMAAKYLGCTLLDLLMFILMLFIGVTMWRAYSFVKLYKKEIVCERPYKKFQTTLTLLYCSMVTTFIIFVDIFKTFQVLVIILFIKQAKPLYNAIQKKKEEKPDWTLADFLSIISYYFLLTLMDIPHIFLIPIKILGFPFLPIHLYLKKRTSELNINPTMSFLNYPIFFLHELSSDCMNYYGFDKFFVINLFGIVLVATNELALAIVVFNCIYMFIVTLGSPLWTETRKKYGWDYLGKAQGPMVVLEYITVVLQAVLFPIFVLMQIVILLLPTLLALGLYPKLGFVEYWQDFFTERAFWHEAKSFSSGIWVAQAFWALVCVASWEITFKVGKKYFSIFSPWKSYYWLVKKIFHGKLWYFYTLILITGTRVCYKLRRACLVGEILMFPLFITWTCWSFIIPIATKIYYIFIASGIISLGLVVIAYRIIKENWTDNRKTQNFTPIINLTSATCELPESGGIIFSFIGYRTTYSCDLPKIVDARLSLESEKLWETIGKVVGSTKVRAALMIVGYPISLCPMFLNIEDITKFDPNDPLLATFQIKIGIEGSKPLIKKKVLTKILNQLREVDDSPFDFTIEFGKKDFGWQKHGIIIKFPTTIEKLLTNTITISNNNNNNNDLMDINEKIYTPKYNNNNKSSSSNNNNNNNSSRSLSASPGLKLLSRPTPLSVPTSTSPPSNKLSNIRSSVEISPDKETNSSSSNSSHKEEAFEDNIEDYDATQFNDTHNYSFDAAQEQQQVSIVNDMSNYLTDDQMNEEFFRSLDTRDKNSPPSSSSQSKTTRKRITKKNNNKHQ